MSNIDMSLDDMIKNKYSGGGGGGGGGLPRGGDCSYGLGPLRRLPNRSVNRTAPYAPDPR